MKRIFKIMLITALLISCKNQTTNNPKKSNIILPKEEKDWSYEGETSPDHWSEIKKNTVCDGESQSPINIIDFNLKISNSTFEINYADSTHIRDVFNNGHTIQYNFEPGDYINLNGIRYNLIQFHFHEPAEHLINGMRYPMEIHLVHSNEEGAYTVLSIMAQEGSGSAPFEFLEQFLPINVNETKTVDQAFNLNLNLPSNRSLFNYTGSLTTPPCTEGVQWLIFKQPITVSLDQVNKLKEIMPLNNYRNEQPINSREIVILK